MASNKTLNTSNLEALGAARLAELLMEISEGNAGAKRRPRLELAGAQSPAELVKEIRKRLAMIALSTRTGPEQLGDQVFNASTRNDHGQFDHLIQALTPALGPVGLEHLKQRVIALSAEPIRRPPQKERRVVAWGSGGRLYADEIAERSRARR